MRTSVPFLLLLVGSVAAHAGSSPAPAPGTWPATGAIFAPQPALARGCAAGEILVAEDEKNFYCLSKKAYNNSPGQKLAASYCKAKHKIAADQDAIRNLGFALNAESYEAMGELAENQQRELKRKVMLAMFDQALSATGKLVDTAKSLNPWNVNRAVKLLEDKGFANAPVVDAMRKIGRVRGKPEMAARYHEFEFLTKGFVNGYTTHEGIEKDPNTAQLQILMGALKTLQGNYKLGLLVTSLEFGESFAYIYYIGGELDDLARQNDENTAKLASLGQRLKDDVGRAVKARKAWQKEFEIPIAPKCKE